MPIGRCYSPTTQNPPPPPLLASLPPSDFCLFSSTIGPLHDPVTWYGKNYTGTQVTQWDFQNKGTRTSSARLSFVLKVPPCNLRPSVIYSVPYDRIVQRIYSLVAIYTPEGERGTVRVKCRYTSQRLW